MDRRSILVSLSFQGPQGIDVPATPARYRHFHLPFLAVIAPEHMLPNARYWNWTWSVFSQKHWWTIRGYQNLYREYQGDCLLISLLPSSALVQAYWIQGLKHPGRLSRESQLDLRYFRAVCAFSLSDSSIQLDTCPIHQPKLHKTRLRLTLH